MANKKLRKLVAAMLASAVMIAAIPTAAIMASSNTEATESDASTEAVTSESVTAEASESAAEETTEASESVVSESTEAEEVISEGTEAEEVVSESTEEATETVDTSEWITIDDYELIVENDYYEMYYYEPRVSIILYDKATGQYMESTLSDENNDGAANDTWVSYMQSGIVINMMSGTTSTVQLDTTTSCFTVDTSYHDDGVSAKMYWEDYGIGVTMDITLEEDELVVNIDDDSIKEDMTDDDYYINTVIMFPFMGYTHLGDVEGYMLIPDGNGALISLEDKEGRYTTGFSQMIYSSDEGMTLDVTGSNLLWDKYDSVVDANSILAPVFGMAHTDEQVAYLAVVENGAYRCNIEAYPNGALTNYNRCYARFLLRQTYVQPLSDTGTGTVTNIESDRTHMDLTVRYLLLSGDDADYSGMANAYRDYLLENEMVEAQDTSYNTRVDVLGSDRETFMFGTRAVAATTVEQLSEIYDELQAKNVKSVLTVYKGWQKGGLYNLPISSYKADSSIGGTSALTKLIEEAEKSDYTIYLYDDALEMNASTNTFTFDAMKKTNQRTYTIDTHQQVYDTFYYLMPTKSASQLKSLVSSASKKGVTNIAVAGITNTLFSWYSQGKYYTRVDTAQYYENAVSSISSSVSLILEQPAVYLWQYTDAILDMPLGSSEYQYVTEEVPFLSMVLKGIIPMYSDYVNFEANKTEFKLKMIEAGVYPSFYVTYESSSALIYTNSNDLYSTQFSTYKDTIVEYDTELRELAELTEGAYIINHEKTDEGVVKVTYDNGVVIYVNYEDEDIEVDGITVGAESYKVGEAE
ncbi:MAG: DUF5696 domain-containing protein [Clostridiales bacterium]|nr:DUF5696 domain-containing protein [Clostridiales bacterium]